MVWTTLAAVYPYAKDGASPIARRQLPEHFPGARDRDPTQRARKGPRSRPGPRPKARRTRRGRTRGYAGQRSRRDRERARRLRALEAMNRLQEEQGLSRRRAASLLGIPATTLGEWDRRHKRDELEPKALGRPAHQSDRDTRNSVLLLISILGPHVGLLRLQGAVNNALDDPPTRGELKDLLERYRACHRDLNRTPVHVLEWTQAGVVWALDFTQPDDDVEDLYPRLLLVRDLASGRILAALPAADQRAERVEDLLEALFVRHGAPLVVKIDNGSEFIAWRVKALLARFGVLGLFSPPRTPSYNGSIEATAGHLKTNAHYQAARAGRPGEWTCDDVEAARVITNQTARPRGHNGTTPEEEWRSRPPIDQPTRAAFRASYLRFEAEVVDREAIARPITGHHERARVDREAIRRALEEFGFISYRRRWVSMPI